MTPDEIPQPDVPTIPRPRIVIEFFSPDSTQCNINGQAGGMPVNPEQMLIASATLKLMYETAAADRFMVQQQRAAQGSILVPQPANGRKVKL